jgi:hypothetical protein
VTGVQTCALPIYPLAKEREFLPVSDGYDSAIGPGHPIACAYKLTTDNFAEAVERVYAGEIGLYIQGICEYEDAFGKPRETKFRYVLGGRIAKTAGMVLHAAERGNSCT